MTLNAIPHLNPPPSACDTHVHIFEPERFAALASATKPVPAPLADYLVIRKQLGISRTIVVQPPAFQVDNGGTLEAVGRLGKSARAVVVVPPTISDSELQRMHDQGARGIRFHMLRVGALSWADMEPMAARLSDLGWHIQIQMDGRELPDRLAMLEKLPVPIVLDHVAKFLGPVDVTHDAFKALLALVGHGKAYVKLSAPYESTRTGAPLYEDVGILAQALVRAAPERMLWGSNWPHHSTPLEKRSDDRHLLDHLQQWAKGDADMTKILVTNPAVLYGFAD